MITTGNRTNQQRAHTDIIYSDGSIRHYDMRLFADEDKLNEDQKNAIRAKAIQARDGLVARHLLFGRDNIFAKPKATKSRKVVGPTPTHFYYWVALDGVIHRPATCLKHEVNPDDYKHIQKKWDVE